MYDVVAAAQEAGVAAVAAGRARPRRSTPACRAVIDDAGWGDAFLHGTGHGVGLDIHEAPGWPRPSTATLAAGHVVTVEPGVYLPEHGGVRIEDTVVVTADGCRAAHPHRQATPSDPSGRRTASLDATAAPATAEGPPMPTITTNDLKNGMTLDLDDGLFQVVEFQHVKPGKGGAFVRTTLRNVRTGAVVDRTFRAGEKVERAIIDKREMQYLYRDGDDYVFMDNETYDQLNVGPASLGDAANYLIESANAVLQDVRRRDRRRRAARRGRADHRRDRARRPGRPRVGRPQAGHPRDRPGHPGAAVRQPRRPRQGRHPHRRLHHPGVSALRSATRRVVPARPVRPTSTTWCRPGPRRCPTSCRPCRPTTPPTPIASPCSCTGAARSAAGARRASGPWPCSTRPSQGGDAGRRCWPPAAAGRGLRGRAGGRRRRPPAPRSTSSSRSYARGWTLERMPAIDRAVLRLATFELVHRPDVPTGA